jgi:chloramphenicol O-acetyltransferase
MKTGKQILSENRNFTINQIQKTLKFWDLKEAMFSTLAMTEKYISFFQNKEQKEIESMISLMIRKVKAADKKSLADLVSGIKEITGDTRSAAEIRMSHN